MKDDDFGDDDDDYADGEAGDDEGRWKYRVSKKNWVLLN